MKTFLFRFRLQLLCIAAGILLYFPARHFLAADTGLIGGTEIRRGRYGERVKTYELTVDGLSVAPVDLRIPVSARQYADTERGKAFDDCMDFLSVSILGGNPSLSEISENLTLPSSVPQYGFNAEWIPSDPRLVDAFGNVKNEDLKEEKELYFKVVLSDPGRVHTADYELPLRVLPKKLSAEERLKKDFLNVLKEQDRSGISSENFSLPQEYEGKKLRYREKGGTDSLLFPILGIACAVLFYLRDQLRGKKENESRSRQLLLDYPEIVSKLMVFIGAGMTIRLAWQNIVSDYETGGGPRRFAYEEMSRALSQLKTGANEGKVYRDFGRSCGIRQYMKLAGLLDQNRRTGIANIRSILGAETIQAWEERKNLARRMGEEASTRLLAPLFIMLAIVMVMIIFPAMISFQ